jgi:hypothetical protein
MIVGSREYVGEDFSAGARLVGRNHDAFSEVSTREVLIDGVRCRVKRAIVRFACNSHFHAEQCVRCGDQDTHARIQLDKICSGVMAKSVHNEPLDLESSKPGGSAEHVTLDVVCWLEVRTYQQQPPKQSSLPHHPLPVELSA